MIGGGAGRDVLEQVVVVVLEHDLDLVEGAAEGVLGLDVHGLDGGDVIVTELRPLSEVLDKIDLLLIRVRLRVLNPDEFPGCLVLQHGNLPKRVVPHVLHKDVLPTNVVPLLLVFTGFFCSH